MNRWLMAGVLVMVGVSAFARDIAYWKSDKQGGSGDWSSENRWLNGVKPSDDWQVRSASGDIIITDADQEIVSRIYEMVVNDHENDCVQFNITGDFTNSVPIYAPVKKDGAGDLVISHGRSVQLLNSKVTVNSGRLIMCIDSALTYSYDLKIAGCLTLAAGTELREVCERGLKVGGLAGSGKLVNTASAAMNLVIAGGTDKANATEFTGEFENFKLAISQGAIRFTDATKSADYGSISMNEGSYAAFAAFPREFAFRVAPAAEVEYLGTADIASGKSVTWVVNDGVGAKYNAGPYGGATWYHDIKGNDAMVVYEFTGDNAATSIFEGTMPYASRTTAAYVIKSGSGTWRLGQNPTGNHGVYDVRKGTLEYLTIAEKGTACSLGTANVTHSEYSGARDDSKAVEYALKLGAGDETVETAATPTLKYVGTTAATVAARPVAINGTGRFASASAALDWTGFSPIRSGTNTLILSGEAADCTARSVTDGTVGTLSVEKEGSGDWLLADRTDFTGDLKVKAGTLTIANDNNYKWYKLVIKQLYDKTLITTMIGHVGFFAADNTEQGLNLTYNANANADNSLLQPGQICLGGSDHTQDFSFPLVNITKPLAHNLNGRFRKSDGSVPAKDNASTWITVVFRLRDDIKPVVKFDIVPGWFKAKANTPFEQTPTDWCLYASEDGVTWTDEPLAGQSDYTQSPTGAYMYWMSDLSQAAENKAGGWTKFDSVGFAVDSEYESSVKKLARVNSLAVSSGATLVLTKNLTTPVDQLRYEPTAGAGTIHGVNFGATGTFDIIGSAPSPLTAAYTFTQCTGVANLANWTVTVNGKAKAGWKLEVTDSGLNVIRPGIIILIK